MTQLVPLSTYAPPALIDAAGDRARVRFIEFFTANIRNPHTRRAYARSVAEFLTWCERASVPSIAAVQPVHVATYIEQLGRREDDPLSAPTIKQQLAAIRQLFDWLVVGQVVPVNPAASVRGPTHVVKKGKTPVLSPDEARRLINSIDATTHVGLRGPRPDRADGLFVRTRRRGARHEGRRRVHAGSPAVGAPAREGWQAPRNAVPPQSGGLPARLH
jgi:integrase/recombinase XerC